MIKGKVQSDNLDSIMQEIETEIDMDIELETQLFASRLRSALVAKIGANKLSHFKIEVGSKDIEIIPIDQTGEFLLSGTKPHLIQAGGKPMPIGGGKFARRVSHPGTPSIIDEIEEAIEIALGGSFL